MREANLPNTEQLLTSEMRYVSDAQESLKRSYKTLQDPSLISRASQEDRTKIKMLLERFMRLEVALAKGQDQLEEWLK